MSDERNGDIDGLYGEWSQQSSDEIRRRISECLRTTAERIAQMAVGIRILEERGEDFGECPATLLENLRAIAYGHVELMLYVRYGSRTLLFQKARQCPRPDQQKIANGEPIKVFVNTPAGIDHRLVKPEDLRREQIHQVFADGRLRSESERRSFAEESAKPRGSVLTVDAPEKDIRVKRKKGAWINGAFFSKAELLGLIQKIG